MRHAGLAIGLLVACKAEPPPPPMPTRAPKAIVSVAPTPSPTESPVSGPKAFLAWAGEARNKPWTYGPTEECYDAASPSFGLCARTHFPDQYTAWSIDFSKKNRHAFKVHAHFPDTALSCEGLGAETLRRWRYASMSKAHCSFTDGALRDLQALVDHTTEASAGSRGSSIHLFSAAFLAAKASFNDVVTKQGL
jgi:hypothetical protein